MKKILLLAAMVVTAFAAGAQVTAQKAAWVNISVPQMKCWVCKEKLQQYLLKETGPSGDGGILQVIINMFNATVRIRYSPDRFSVDDLRTSIANAGYDADTVKANEDSYKLLPPICKRKEDGGGPQKGQPPCTIPQNQR